MLVVSFCYYNILEKSINLCKTIVYVLLNTGADPKGGGEYWKKYDFFCVKSSRSWFFTRNTPTFFALPSARRDFFKCAPPPNLKSWIRPWNKYIKNNLIVITLRLHMHWKFCFNFLMKKQKKMSFWSPTIDYIISVFLYHRLLSTPTPNVWNQLPVT